MAKKDKSEDSTFPKALKSGRTYSSTYGEAKYPITDKQGRPELMDIEESKKRGYPSTSDDRLINARGVVTEYVEDFPNMKRSKAATEAEKEVKMKKGGAVKSSASRRADGIATKGKTKGRII